MNKDKRKAIIKILNSGHSLINISEQISLYLNQPSQDIERIISLCGWDIKKILWYFNYFPESKNNIIYYKH